MDSILNNTGLGKMEKRAHPRFESHVEATLVTPDGSSLACHIADFSQDGLRIYWHSDSDLQLQSGEALQLQATVDNSELNMLASCL